MKRNKPLLTFSFGFQCCYLITQIQYLDSALFGLLSSSSLLSVQRFGWYALRPSSGISCQTWEPSCCNWESSQNFEPNPLFSPRGYPVLIPLTIAGAEALSCVIYYSMLLLVRWGIMIIILNYYYSMLLLHLTRIEPAVEI